SESAAASRASTNQNEHDATQAAIAAIDITGGVTAGLSAQGYTATRAGKLDRLDADISSRESESSAATRATADQAEHDATQAAIAAIDIVSDVGTALTNQGYTTTRAIKLDNLDFLTAIPPTLSEIVIGILEETTNGYDSGTVGHALETSRDQSSIAAI